MHYNEDLLKELFGEGFNNLLSTSSSEAYANRCSELRETVRRFQVVLKTIYRRPIEERVDRLHEDLEYVSIFRQLRAFSELNESEPLEFTESEALENGADMIEHALYALMEDIEELGKKFAFEHTALFSEIG